MSNSSPGLERAHTRATLRVFPERSGPARSLLPASLTPLVGREQDAALVADMLTSADVRLVTLTGPGGIGKTRLALQLAADLADAFLDGVTFVDLAPLLNSDIVIPAICQRLGLLPDTARPPIEALQTYLRSLETLLVLDNFEQVLRAGPELTEVLKACPHVKMLLTSRTRLHLSAEHAVLVPPLALPTDTNRGFPLSSPADLSEVAAVRLFVQRARAADPAFALTEQNSQAVSAIVQRLDGLPLAIELAAARIPLFTPSELVERLEHRLPQLTGGPHDHPKRLQTMRNSIAWSYDLLTPAEQAVFRCLAVFAGGGTLAAAEEVCKGQQLEPVSVDPNKIREQDETEAQSPASDPLLATSGLVDIIESLTNQSLLEVVKPVSHESAGSPTRLMMLETVHEFAADQLATIGDHSPARRHAAYYLALATRAARVFYGDESGDWRDLIEPEQGNLRAALAWAVESGEADISLSLASAMEWAAFLARGVWDPVGLAAALAREQEQWVQRALAMPGGSPAARARALISAAWATLVRDLPRSSSLSEEALELARLHEDPFALANASAARGLAALHQGDTALALPYLHDALSGFRALDQPGRAAWVLSELAVTETRKAVDEGGDPAALARAVEYYEEALAFFETIGQNRGISRAMHGMAYVAYKQRKLPKALKQIREILIRDWEQRAPVTHYIEDIADIAGRIGRPDVAVRLYGAAEAQRERVGRPIHSLFREEYESEVAISRQALSESAFTEGWAAGRALTLEEAVGEALSSFERESAGSGHLLGITSREHEVLKLLVAGKSDRDIAEALFISRRTAEGHVRSICRKLGARSRAAAVSAELASGMADPPSQPQDSPHHPA